MDDSAIDNLAPEDRARLIQLQYELEGQDLAPVLEKLMKQFGLSVKETAVAAGMDEARLQNILKGEYRQFKAGAEHELMGDSAISGKLRADNAAGQFEKTIWLRAVHIATFLRPEFYRVVEPHIRMLQNLKTRETELSQFLMREYPALMETDDTPDSRMPMFVPLANIVSRELLKHWDAGALGESHLSLLGSYDPPRPAEDLPVLSRDLWIRILREDPKTATEKLVERGLVVPTGDGRLRCSEAGTQLVQYHKQHPQIAAESSTIPPELRRAIGLAVAAAATMAVGGIVGNRADAAFMELLGQIGKALDGAETKPAPAPTLAPTPAAATPADAPKSADDYAFSAHVYSLMGQLDLALRDYDKAIELNPILPPYVFKERAEVYVKKGDLDQALRDCNKIIQFDPGNYEFYRLRAEVYVKKSDLDQALRDCDKAIELNPVDSHLWELWSYRAEVYASKGDFDQALQGYNGAIELKPCLSQFWDTFRSRPDLFPNRAEVYSSKENLERALRDLNKTDDPSLRIHSASWEELFHRRAQVYFKKGDLDQALRAYNQVMEISGGPAHLFANLAEIYFKKGDLDQALREYGKAIASNNYDSVSFRCRAEIYVKKGDLDQALRDYSRVIELHPVDEKGYFDRGSVYERKHNWEQALRDYTQAIAQNPKYADAYFSRGRIYYQYRKLKAKAIADLKAYLQLDPTGEHQADARRMLGDLLGFWEQLLGF